MEGLDRFIEELGVDLYGYADLRSFDENLRGGLPYGISFGIAVDADIIRKIPDGPFMDYVQAYSTITDRLDEISILISEYLTSKGYKAIAQVRSYVGEQIEKSKNSTDNVYGTASMPHKTVAASAGLGWITKSALIVTEKYGSAVRFSSVLTDAPLNPQKHEYICHCGSCSLCKDNCPTGAILGVEWTDQTTRAQLIDYALCQKSFRERGSRIGINTGGGTCGVCIAVCPHTKRYLNE